MKKIEVAELRVVSAGRGGNSGEKWDGIISAFNSDFISWKISMNKKKVTSEGFIRLSFLDGYFVWNSAGCFFEEDTDPTTTGGRDFDFADLFGFINKFFPSFK